MAPRFSGLRRSTCEWRWCLCCRITQTTLWHVKTSCKSTVWPISKDLVYSVSSQKIQYGWASAIWQLDALFDTVRVRIVCGAGSIKQSGVRPSVSLSHQSNAAAACSGFAAECRTCKRYRSTAPGARQQQRRSPGPQHGAQQQMRAMSRWQPSWRCWTQTWVTFYFRPIKILAVFTACVEFVSEWQHARNYVSTHCADWTWMDRRTKISHILSWKIWQPYRWVLAERANCFKFVLFGAKHLVWSRFA